MINLFNMKSGAKALAVISTVFMLFSCQKDGKIKVENQVSNVSLRSINWGSNSIYEDLYPGEQSSSVSVSDFKDNWPKTHPLEFVMESGGNSVYLKTEEEYMLDYGQEITIVITDSTPVYNP